MKQFSNDTRKNLEDLTAEEKKIVELLQNENLHFDDLVRVAKIDSAKLSEILTVLEIKKIVKNFSDGTIGLLTS